MRIVVTGAAGFIGSHLCERLVAEGHRVVGVDNFSDAYPRPRKEANLSVLRGESAFDLVEADIRTAGEALRDAQAVLHFAALPGARGREEAPYVEGNVEATAALLRACRDAAVPRLLLASSSSVYGDARGASREDDPLRPLSPYARTKAEAERLCRASGIPTVTLRYFTVYGPRQRPDMAFARWIEAALSAHPATLLGTGAQARDFTHVQDAVQGTMLGLERGAPGRTYNVAGGRSVPVHEALAVIEDALGRKVPVQREEAVSEPLRTWADLGRARSELGYAPQVPLDAGLRTQVEAALACAS